MAAAPAIALTFCYGVGAQLELLEVGKYALVRSIIGLPLTWAPKNTFNSLKNPKFGPSSPLKNGPEKKREKNIKNPIFINIKHGNVI